MDPLVIQGTPSMIFQQFPLTYIWSRYHHIIYRTC